MRLTPAAMPQIIVNPHEVVGRSHSGSRSTSKAVLAVAVLAALACLAFSGLDSAPASTRASFAEARAVSSPLAKAAHPVPTKNAAIAAKKQLHATSPVMMHAMKQHLALAKQVSLHVGVVQSVCCAICAGGGSCGQ